MLTALLTDIKSFALARVIMTAIELDIFPMIDKEPLGRSALKQQLGIADSPIADAFLDVLVAFEVLAEEGEKLRLLPLARSALRVYESIRSWNKEMQLFYSSLDDLTGMLRSGRYQNSVLSNYWVYKKSPERKTLSVSEIDDYSQVMETSQEQLSKIIAEQYDFTEHEHIIEFGGGYGRLAITLAKTYPNLRITIADLPTVCEGARARVSASGLEGRITCLPVDFFRDRLPAGAADDIFFVRVLHDWSDDEVNYLLKRTRYCLKTPGVAVVVEPMMDETAKPDRSSVLSSLMLTLFGGRRRSVQWYIRLLRSAGYGDVSWHDCGLSLYKMVVARV